MERKTLFVLIFSPLVPFFFYIYNEWTCVCGENIQIMWKHLMSWSCKCKAAKWELPGRKVAQAGLFLLLCGSGIVLRGTNFSLLMRNSRVRSMTCLTLPPFWPVYLPECVMHWRASRSYNENRVWGRWEWTSADGRFMQPCSWWQTGLLVSLCIVAQC